MRRLIPFIVASLVTFCGVAMAAPKKAAARDRNTTSAPARKSGTNKGTMKQCSSDGSRGKKKCKRVAVFQGHNASKTTLRTEPLDKPSGDVWLHVENLDEEIKLNIYKADGTFDDAALAKLDDMFRCVRTGEVRAVRTELYEQLSRIYDHFGGKRVELVSGFRFAERNSSRHYHASAMDIRIRDVSIREMYSYAESLDQGHMGIGLYPTSGFIHVDFRAPGEPSYRWTDWSGHGGGGKKKKAPARTQPARKPVS
jgi:uncharacterized protein YcbK (DUF882 family)